MAARGNSPRRWAQAVTVNLLSGRDLIWYIFGVLSILSILTHELSRHSVHAAGADFEGFDFEEDESDDERDHTFTILPPSPPVTTQSHTPESHHGPPKPSDPVTKPSKIEEEWDEDEFEGFSTQIHDDLEDEVNSSTEGSASETPNLDSSIEKKQKKSFPGSYPLEILCVSFLVAFAVNFFTGKKENERIALAWVAKFAGKDAIFEKNFSLLGTGDGMNTPLLLKEGQDVFKFYASGRRYCQRLLATLELKNRHDLISKIVDLVLPKEETITFEVVMNDDAMENIVFAMGKKKLAKSMHKEEFDLQRYAGLMTNAPHGRKWVPEELLVVSESKEIAGDMLNDAVLDQVFGEKAYQKFGKWFISMHFSDQHYGSQKKVLKFKFIIPNQNDMGDMTRLVALVPYYIDLVGRYKLSSQARTKTVASRTKAAQEAYREMQNARQEELQKRKAEKKRLADEASVKLSAEAMRKREEKDRARQMKKGAPKVKMLRSH
ncbi:putative Coiled-coil domain-containing protein 47 [Zostera marina]|uniref:Putative Coiled-coil domain-containing protein 47 n=1 Tax=Zostera marina TaxID=29655 RepID=A0A0K9NQR2_ZOSMR|nr:putative Coiled-coil domain-containing protein 47 [Zostera marina]